MTDNNIELILIDKNSLFDRSSIGSKFFICQDNCTTKYCRITICFPRVRLRDFSGGHQLESGLGDDTFNLTNVEGLQLFTLVDEKSKLQAGRPGIENKNEIFHSHHLTSYLPARRAFATSAMTAADVSRVRTESARLVRTTGIRVPSTIPAPSPPAR